MWIFNSQKEDIYWFDHSRMANNTIFKKDDKFKGKTNNTVNKGKDMRQTGKNTFSPWQKTNFLGIEGSLTKQ